jgi:hypothetical protein
MEVDRYGKALHIMVDDLLNKTISDEKYSDDRDLVIESD